MSKTNVWRFMLWGAMGGMVTNVIKQYFEVDDGTKEKFAWDELFQWTAIGGAIGGGTGLVLDLVTGIPEKEPKFRETRYLREVLKSYNPLDTSEFEFQRRKSLEISEAIQEEFQQFVYHPEVSGSFGKGTGIAGSSDFDLLVPYPKHTFRTLEEMFEVTHAFLVDYAAGDAEIWDVRKQGVSIGLRCAYRGGETRLDIVPARERADYLIDGDLSLHVHAKDWFSQATYTKTNIHKHKELMMGHKSKRELVRLFKIWKDNANVNVSGFELELLVNRAYEAQTGRLPNTLFGKLLSTATYIHDGLDSMALHDPGVSSKQLLDDPARRKQIQRKLGNMLYDVSADGTNLEKYFPPNA